MYISKTGENKILNVVIAITIYCLLLLNSGFALCALGGTIEFVRVGLAVLFLFFARGIIRKRNLYTLLALLLIMIVSSIVNGDDVVTVMVIAFDIVAAFCIASYCAKADKLTNLIEIFKKFMLVLCIFSSLAFLVASVKSSAFYGFPVFKQGYQQANFLGLSFVYKVRRYNYLRNLGIFWEPGAFQTYIIMAMIAEMFLTKKENKRVLNLVVYTVATITTISTTGILTMAALWAVYAFTHRNKWAGFVLSALIVGVVALVILNQEALPEEIRFALFDKTEAMLDSDSNMVTSDVRLDSVKYPLQAFLGSPVIGVGRSGMHDWAEITGHTMNTCTPINWLAHYGIFAFLIIMIGFYRFTRLMFKNFLQRIAVLAVFLLSIATEAFNYEPTILFVAFVGYQLSKDYVKYFEEPTCIEEKGDFNEDIIC